MLSSLTDTREPRAGTHAGDEDVVVFAAGARAVSVLVATALIVLAQLYAAIPLLDPVGESLGGDVTFALSTAYGMCYAAGFLVWGPIADRYGRKRILVVGLICLMVATAGCAVAGSVPVLAMLRAVQGLAAASFAPVALAYLSEAVSPRHRAMAIGAMSTAFLVAGIAGQVIAQVVALRFGWAWVFAASAVVLAVCALVVALVVREPALQEPDGGLGRQFLVVARLIVKPSVLWLCAADVMLLLAFVALYTGLGAQLATHGIDAGAVIWLRLVALPGMFAALAAGPLARRLGGSAGLARTGCLLAATGLVLLAAFSGSLVGIGAASLVFVTGIALAVPAMITLFGQASAPQIACGMAINGLVLFTGASIGPLLGGIGLDFPVLLLILAALLSVAAGCVSVSAHLTTREITNGATP